MKVLILFLAVLCVALFIGLFKCKNTPKKCGNAYTGYILIGNKCLSGADTIKSVKSVGKSGVYIGLDSSHKSVSWNNNVLLIGTDSYREPITSSKLDNRKR